ncbi:PepSY-associated TM helix domain-containing protein [Galbibacter sp. EGI 63066]|uniref:PepSY-associated TM helix domain-containing protein n=1 Tax=Galbibacter sp. EGI 63066 TaxID=2993559 RepID=UPI002249150D|nr:PepSY-associated TM helix domain-containing protein [Galbibacter sp. EGI 63066]MCX2679545.1 PepSY-associated TM helix domain-containing protein [Galbibacter sp. EGI 63066]
MNKRQYNILFNTHTISGIVISAALYIIFFTGSFAFFRDEIANWQKNEAVAPNYQGITANIDLVIDSLQNTYQLYGRDIEIASHYNERRVSVNLGASKDSLTADKDKVGAFFYMDTKTYDTYNYLESYTLGEFLYRLHFFAQIKYPIGYYLSGFVALFFLFAIITGILVHWNKIVSNFYTFRPKAKLKTIWTDAHTALGVIGLPFQFVYAVTGSLFMLTALVAAPNIMLLYDGDQQKMYEDLELADKPVALGYEKLNEIPSIEGFIDKTKDQWEDFQISHVHIFNYGDSNMRVSVEGELDDKKVYNDLGKTVYQASTGEIIAQKDPTNPSYLNGVRNVMYRLHYGDYGGFALRLISFVLGIVSCFVIISGVLIWLVARDKKNVPEKKRRFNSALVNIYLSVCLSMYPITALTFIAVKVFHPAGQSFLYNFYFIGWLLLSVFFIIKKNHFFTNKYCLLSGSILGLLIPVSNGITTGNWFWKAYANGHFQSFFIDVFWIVLALITLWVTFKLKKKPNQKPLKIEKAQH